MSEMTKAAIVQQLDHVEAELFALCRAVERLRLDLQRQWNVLPSDATKPEKQRRSDR